MFYVKWKNLLVSWCFFCYTITTAKKNERVVPVNRDIAYGGVLSNYIDNVSTNDTDIQEAAKFAVSYGHQRFPAAFPESEQGNMRPYEISKAKKLKLLYTEDDHSPWYSDVRDPSTGEIISMPLVLGVTVAFRISWPNIGASFVHQFIVTEYRSAGYFVHQHTFHRSDTRMAGDARFHAKIPQPKPNVAMVSETETSMHVDVDLIDDIVDHERRQEDIVERGHCDKDGGCEGIPDPLDKYKDPDELDHCTDRNSNDCKEADSDGMKIHLLSYNIWNFNTQYEDTVGGKYYWRRIRQLSKLVLKSDAPIVGFQEVRFDGGREDSHGPSQVEHLAATLKQYQINVLNTHLSLSHVARQRTVRQIWKYIQKLAGPVFFMGDFNAEAHNDEVRFLVGKTKLGGTETHGLVDIWERLHPDDDGFTFNTLDEIFSKRIDLLLMREDERVSLLDASLIDDYKRKAEAASDHIGLMGTFLIKNFTAGTTTQQENVP